MPTFIGTRLAGQVYGDLTGSIFEPSVVSIANVVSGTLPVARGGTGANYFESKSLAIGNGNSSMTYVSHPTDSGVLYWDSGSADWTYINFYQSIPYDISGEFIGYPAGSQIILRSVAARTYKLSTTGSDHYFRAITSSVDCNEFTVKKNGTTAFIIEYGASSNTGSVAYQLGNVDCVFSPGDILTVVAQTGSITVGDLFFTLKGNL